MIKKQNLWLQIRRNGRVGWSKQKVLLGRCRDGVLQQQYLMLCGCPGKRKAESVKSGDLVDSPLQMQLVKMLGLKKYLLDKFVFRVKSSSYSLCTIQGSPTMIDQKTTAYRPPPFYSATPYLLETIHNSVPVVRLRPTGPSSAVLPVVIYGHGNSSDMGDSLHFISRMAEKFRAEYVVFDYTGYGASRKKEVGEEVIVKDLSIVLSWLACPLDRIILWGFSLGSYPVVVNSARFKVAGTILQCPIGSLSCMFYDQYSIDIRFKDDHFANIDHIASIDSKILMMHSIADEIIPIEQARLLYHKYLTKRGEGKIEFIEVQKINHNAFHKYICSTIPNDLQKEVLSFIETLTEEMNKKEQERLQKSQEEGAELIPPESQPEELIKLRQFISEVKLEQQDFFQENFELVETEELNQPSKTKPNGEGWLCWGK